MPTKKDTRRLGSDAVNPRIDQELIDDEKFQQKLEMNVSRTGSNMKRTNLSYAPAGSSALAAL